MTASTLDETDGTSLASARPQDVSRIRVLVVDDNWGAAKILSLLLSRLGPYDVEIAGDAKSTVDTVRRFKPDVVFLDIGLPSVDGYQVAQQLRQIEGFDETLLVAVTGYGQDEDLKRSAQAGFDFHLVKPVDLTSLRAVFTHPKVSHA